MTPRRFVPRALAALLTLSLVAVACGGDEDEASSGPAATTAEGEVDLSGVTLRVGPFLEHVIEVSEQSGVFDDLPYEVEWSVQAGAGPAMEALNADAVDLVWGLSATAPEKALGDAAEPWTAEDSRFATVGLIEPLHQDELPRSVVIAGPGHDDIESLEDLEGRRVGFNTGGINHALYLLALQAGGLTTDDVEGVDVPYKDRPQILRSGDIDVDANSYELHLESLDEGAHVVATNLDVDYPAWTALVTRTAALEDPATEAAIGDFIERIAELQVWWDANVEQVGEVITDFSHVEPEAGLLRAQLGSNRIIPVSPENIASEQEVLDRLHEAGFTRNQVDIDVLFDDRYTDVIEAAGEAPADAETAGGATS